MHPGVRGYFTTDPRGGVAIENAATGLSLGMHAEAITRKILAKVDEDFQAKYPSGGRPANPAEAGRLLVDQRFPPAVGPAGTSVRPLIDPTVGGLFAANTPDISAWRLASFRLLRDLPALLSDADTERLLKLCRGAAFPSGKTPDYDEVASALQRIPLRERHFTLAPFRSGGPGLGNTAVAIGWQVVWFTAYAEVRRLRRELYADGFAERARDALGLEHMKQGDWLVLLTFPGTAVQRRGHHRPIFCDPGNRRFMAGSSHRDHFPISPWGQTADLLPIEAADPAAVADFDGASERVSPPLSLSDFDGARVRFHVFGPLNHTRATAANCDAAFALRLALRNATRAIGGAGTCV